MKNYLEKICSQSSFVILSDSEISQERDSSLKKLRMTLAFTLAEVLITLVIIGVVAAMTIPVLLNSFQYHEIQTQLKETYSLLSRATLTLQANGDLDLTTAGTMVSSYASVLAVAKTSLTVDDYPASYFYYKSSTGDVTTTFTTIANSFILNNGTWVAFALRSPTCASVMADEDVYSGTVCGNFNVDINGLKGPNMFGKDMHSFWLLRQGGSYVIKPWGLEGHYACAAGPDVNTSRGCTPYYFQNQTLP